MTPVFPRTVHFFHPYFRDGGVERNIAILARELEARGVRTQTLTLGVPLEDPATRVAGAPPLTDLGARRAVAAVIPLARHLRRARPDVLLSFQTYANVTAVLANLLAGRPTRVIVSERTAISRERGASAALRSRHPLKDRLLLALMRVGYRAASLVSANSADGARDLERTLGFPPGSVHVLYNPTFDPSVRVNAAAPLNHPFFTEAYAAQRREVPVIVAVGRLEPQKDFPTLVEAFARVRARRACRLVIVGEGGERAALKALAASLGVEGDVDLPGFDPNPWRYIARADVFVLSSLWEGLPNALIEAVALGVPAVATACLSGPREILLDGRGGTLVPPGDGARMAEAIAAVLDDPARARALSTVAQGGLSRFETAGAVEAYLRVMKRLVDASLRAGRPS